MRLFLGAHGAGLTLGRIKQTRLLLDLAAVLDHLDLAPRLVLNRLLDIAIGIDVLDLASGAQVAEATGFAELRVAADPTNRHVHVGAQIALLHVAVAGAQINQYGPQLLHIGRRLFG